MLTSKNNFVIFCYILFLFVFALSAFYFLLSPSLTLAFSADNAKDFAAKANTEVGAEDVEVTAVAANIAKGVFSTGGIIFFLLVFYGGYTWLMARGEEEQIQKARNIIIGAIIGLFIMVGSYAITNFVLSKMLAGQSAPATETTTGEPKGPLGCCLNEVQAPSGFWDVGSMHHWNSEITDKETCDVIIITCTKEDELCESKNGVWLDKPTDKDECWEIAESKPTN